MKKLLSLSIFIAFFGICFAQTQSTTTKTTEKKANQPTETKPTTETKSDQVGVDLNFIQTAETARLRAIASHPGYYTLTLYNAAPYMTYFSDRPQRLQGVAAVENFVKAWAVGPNNFAVNPPNGVITGARINGIINRGNVNQILILTHPIYNIKEAALQFTARPLGSKAFLYKSLEYKHATLFIDGRK